MSAVRDYDGESLVLHQGNKQHGTYSLFDSIY